MSRPVLVLLIALSLLSSGSLFADQTPSAPPDDSFNLFLLFLGTAFWSVIPGAVVVGSFAATLFLFFLFGLVSAGVLTTSVLVGLYKRSFSEGFKTLSIIVCSLGGIPAGILAMLFVNGLFRLNLSHTAAIGSGAAAGLIGGALLGLSLSFLFRFFTDYFRKKLSLTV